MSVCYSSEYKSFIENVVPENGLCVYLGMQKLLLLLFYLYYANII